MSHSVVEKTLFSRAPDGWVFAAPHPWLLGVRRGYLVSDGQKANILRRYEQGRTARYLLAMLVLAALVAAASLALPGPVALPSAVLWIVMLGTVVGVAFGVNLADYWSVREELATLAAPTRRVGWLELQRRQAGATPVATLAGVTACNALATCLLAVQWVMLAHAPFALIAAVACGFSALVFGGMLVVRLRA